ncbi:hypothetical protein [Chitinophaga sp. Cy-1792]|uniref:hypothetical protein n=1 Tax=Chitinophaga sp. Cy-1792 TaxID=2608339 RepID=UPI0014239F28|nr:hypothetical protein [Chitinophaga sp. Cy-1792]NIG54100.1 hypothetical protein [Chitinophaga sp. Cy-1792]
MYPVLLSIHSLLRWVVVVSMVLSLITAWQGMRSKREFSSRDVLLRKVTVSSLHIQLILGVWLYCISPVVHYFLENFSTAVHMREIRFFGMEHITMMTTAVVLVTIGASKSKRKSSSHDQFRTMLIWYSIAFVIMFFSIPWAFSPLTHRPYFRL